MLPKSPPIVTLLAKTQVRLKKASYEKQKMLLSGDSKVFRSSMPGTRDKDQICISYDVTGMLFPYCTTSSALY